MNQRFQRPISAWIKFSIWAIVYILFIVWVGNFWWLFLLPTIFDVFITKFIPWGWWKKTENKVLKSIFSWIDAIVFALIAVYFINQYVFQNYQIPTSSLEQTLLVGDFLAVNKAAYGPRIPNTPLSMPLMQHTFPLFGCKSYIENPQWEYRRLAGYDTVECGDIVVFNFPAGDTVPLLVSNPDFYTIAFESGQFASNISTDSIMSYDYYRRRLDAGKKVVEQQSDMYGEIVWRPVDRRENYVKRCVGLPGNTIEIIDNQIYIDGKKQTVYEGVQHNYFVQTDGPKFSADALLKINVSVEETSSFTIGQIPDEYLATIGLKPLVNGTYGHIYRMALNAATLEKVKAMPIVKGVAIEKVFSQMGGSIFPFAYSNTWTRDNYGPLWIPRRGATIELTEENILKYDRCIVNFEGNTLSFKDGVARINGKVATSYTFKMDYYWMMGDNRHNSADSRMWGFVPEDHIVGRPMFVWLSLNRDKGWFDGKIRWNRFFKDASK